jgi:hypothetical protein
MRRREFIADRGGAAAWPLGASARQPPAAGFLEGGSPDTGCRFPGGRAYGSFGSGGVLRGSRRNWAACSNA